MILLTLAVFVLLLGCLGQKAPLAETPKIPASEIKVVTADGYLLCGNGTASKIRLIEYTFNITTLKEGIYHTTHTASKPEEVERVYLIKPGEPVILIKGTIRNDYDDMLYVALWARGYDSSGREIARSVGGGAPGTPWSIGTVVDLESGKEKSFELIIKYNESISTIKIFVGLSRSPLP